MRHVVAHYTDPSFKLAKYLAQWFCSISGYKPKFTIKNSVQLAKKLHSLDFPADSNLISFDAERMFTSIPVNIAEELLTDILLQKGMGWIWIFAP